jgi:hypothetical protein
MSRKVIVILFILATCLFIPGIVMVIWGYAIVFQTILQTAQQTGETGTTSNFDPNTFTTFAVLLYGGIALMGLGAIAQLVTRIGALMEMAKAQEWTWFVLTIIFDWFVILIYLIAVRPKPNPAPQYPVYPASPYAAPIPVQPWPGYSPQATGAVPPTAQPWSAYPTPQMPGAVPPTVQAWSNNPMQAPGATQPAEQPLPYPLQTPQQKAPDKPQE